MALPAFRKDLGANKAAYGLAAQATLVRNLSLRCDLGRKISEECVLSMWGK